MKKPSSVLIASLIAVAALVACGKKEDAAPAVVTPPPAPVTEPAPTPAAPPAAAPASAPSAAASSALDAANAATEAAKKGEAPKQ